VWELHVPKLGSWRFKGRSFTRGTHRVDDPAVVEAAARSPYVNVRELGEEETAQPHTPVQRSEGGEPNPSVPAGQFECPVPECKRKFGTEHGLMTHFGRHTEEEKVGITPPNNETAPNNAGSETPPNTETTS